ncbi:prepilin-type N-terminal cleavage/methylation domain-containing protein [Metabacillus sp. KIGAM252]|uniref:ComG operon protein 3 n=1 Tax=Metabacillus flavus TaxID=2823519 RepID=A0ABS5LFZ7_9BACI|nr:competence type IV pilus major pilin ComGC [Metabacillus flavus]MBS2969672.1 prepilin-type N-terminal cleavage/methylation domain-containing protein [Metabacillus flavus]
MKNQKGFTLIEMLIVLLVITILLLVTIPNIANHSSNIQNKGCSGLRNMISAQAEAYRMNKETVPTIAVLQSEGYIKSNKCPDGTEVTLDSNGAIVEPEK